MALYVIIAQQGPKVMQMHLGSRRGASADQAESVGALPTPTDASVRVSVAGGELLAVAQFEGYITPTSAAAARQTLLAALKRGECSCALCMLKLGSNLQRAPVLCPRAS
jgi:hypothetical protein